MEDFVFDFLLLPLEIQEIIVNEIVHNHVPDDWLHFAQTSQYSNWLVKRANPKKIIKKFEVVRSTSISTKGDLVAHIYSERCKKEVPIITGLNMLQNCQIQELSIEEGVFFEDSNVWNSELETFFCKASRFVTELFVVLSNNVDRFVNYYQHLKHLSEITIRRNISNILLLPWLPPNVDIGRYGDDRNLESFLLKIAQTMRNRPISSLRIRQKVSVHEVKEFLQTSSFLNGAEIHLHIDKKDHEIFKTEIKPFVKGEPIPFETKTLFMTSNNGFLLTENLDIVPDENRNIIGIKIWCW